MSIPAAKKLARKSCPGARARSEFPALDEPPRFWAEKWAEFKRLLRLSWDESSARGTLALSAALIIVGCIMGVVDKLS